MANQLSAYELAEKAEGLAYEIPADWSSGEPKNVATDIAAMLRQQADRIAELEKDGKVCATCGGLVYDPVLKQTKPAHDFNTLTLDTGEKRSLNRLSDEEILDLTIWNKNFYELYVEMEKEDMIAFARAIEERHGIK